MVLKNPWGYGGKTVDDIIMRGVIDAMFAADGVIGANDYLVEAQTSPAPNVKIRAGLAVVIANHSGEGGKYLEENDASVTTGNFSATSGNGRWDYLILRLTAGVPAFEIVPGTPAPGPVAPTITGDNFIPLALVKIPPGTTNIDGSMIVDARTFAYARPPAGWAPWVPTFTASGGGSPLINNGTITGRQQTIGKRCDFNFALTLGTTTTFGTGTLQVSLPATPKQSGIIGYGLVIDASANQGYVAIMVYDQPSGKTLIYWNSAGGGGFPVVSGSAATPITFAVGDSITMAGSFEVA